MKYIVLLGRIFYSLIFVVASLGSGIIALLGGLSVALGYKAKSGAWLLVLFFVPVTVMMHNFWSVSDPMMARMQQVMFMKNLAMLGGALLIAHFGAGPLSLDARLRTRSMQSPTVQA